MSPTVACANCSEPVAAGARFCSRCGHDVSGPQGNLTTNLIPLEPEAHDPGLLTLEHLRRVTLGEYDVVGELGRGGMAIVYLAHDIALDRKVAIKVMNPGLLMGFGMADRFKREARTAASLTHPNIIPIHTVRETEGLLYFVMKYVEGRGLDSIIAEYGPLPVRMVLTILNQVGGALGYAHRRGVVHRDIKPANILIDTEGWVVVTDFGIAKVAEAGSLTVSGMTVGTPRYMSPEQCSSKPVSGASDQYSLGIVSYEMLGGRPPFAADSLMEIMRMHFFEPPPPLLGLRPECPPALASAIERMLAKDADQRWPTVEDAMEAAGRALVERDDPVRSQLMDIAKTGIKPIARVSHPVSPTPLGRSRPQPAAGSSVTRAPAQEPSQVSAPAVTASRPGRKALVWGIGGLTALVLSVGAYLLTRELGAPPIQPAPTVPSNVTPPPVVVAAVASIAISPPSGSIPAKGTLQLSAVAQDSAAQPLSGRAITWSTQDSAIATVTADGLVTGVSPGVVTLEGVADGIRGQATITVTAPPPVTEVKTTGTLKLLLPGSWANVTIDRKSWGRRDQLQVQLPAGARHTVHLERPGYEPLDTSVTVRAGETQTLRLGLRRAAAPIPSAGPRVLRVQILSSWATVSIDGKDLGQRRSWSDSVGPGPHRLRFEREGYITVDTTVTVQPAETLQLRIDMKRRSP